MNTKTIERGREYLLWDGDCGFCRRCAQITDRLDERSTFIVAPYQNFLQSELKKVGLNERRCARELQVISASGKTFGGAFAINYFLWRQPRLKFLVVLGLAFPLLFLIEILLYKIVADNRLWFSKILFPNHK